MVILLASLMGCAAGFRGDRFWSPRWYFCGSRRGAGCSKGWAGPGGV